MASLEDSDRRFFARVAQAAFANPFSQEREQLDAELSELAPDDPAVLRKLAQRLAGRLDKLGHGAPVRLERYRGDDRELMFAALLFHVFHRYLDDIDKLIELEEKESSAPKVRFAKS